MRKLIIILIVASNLSTIAFSQWTPNKAYNYTNDSIISELIIHGNQDRVHSYIQSLEDFGTRFMMAPNHRNLCA